MTTLTTALITGTLFGASLTASAVWQPSVITSQLSLTSTHMLSAFLTASSISALIIYISNRAYTSLPPRTNTSYGWFGAYDANLVGGVLQGLAMAITGACPGTGIVQFALGIPGAGWIMLGGVAGGLGFVVLSPKLKRTKMTGNDGPGVRSAKGSMVRYHTVMQRLNVSDEVALLGYEMILICVILAIDGFIVPPSLPVLYGYQQSVTPNPIVGGLFIGVAQAVSVLLSKKTLGVSSAYSDLASNITSFVKGKGLSSGFGNIVFAIGVGLGAILTRSRDASMGTGNGIGLSVPTALIGGFLSIFGARMAGGCTSGHGISGMSTLSISSFVTVVGMFGGGIAFRTIMDRA